MRTCVYSTIILLVASLTATAETGIPDLTMHSGQHQFIADGLERGLPKWSERYGPNYILSGSPAGEITDIEYPPDSVWLPPASSAPAWTPPVLPTVPVSPEDPKHIPEPNAAGLLAMAIVTTVFIWRTKKK